MKKGINTTDAYKIYFVFLVSLPIFYFSCIIDELGPKFTNIFA